MSKKNELIEFLSDAGKILGILIGGLFILFAIYLSVFVLWRPFMGEITEDRPIMKVLCEMQAACGSGKGPYTCSFNGKEAESSAIKLRRWSGYHGCNESTEDYNVYKGESGKREWGRINVESCGCGGLM